MLLKERCTGLFCYSPLKERGYSMYLFGLGKGHLGKMAATIAKGFGAELVNFTGPRGEKRHWFASRNFGSPFNESAAQMVVAAVSGIKRRK